MSFLLSTTVPIPKGRNSNLTDLENYSGITSSLVFGRLLDLIVSNRYSEQLTSGKLHIGSKHNCMTAMCLMIAKEVISCYTNFNSSVHCVFLDSSKAFDRIEYCKLFRLLLFLECPVRQLIRCLGVSRGPCVLGRRSGQKKARDRSVLFTFSAAAIHDYAVAQNIPVMSTINRAFLIYVVLWPTN
jgi:hypothetical protein